MHEIGGCLDLRRGDSDPEVYAAASSVRHVGTLIANGGSVYGQFDLVDALHPSEIEALLTCKVEIAKKTTRFLSEWHMNWRMLSEEWFNTTHRTC
jgi:hypothetical protein